MWKMWEFSHKILDLKLYYCSTSKRLQLGHNIKESKKGRGKRDDEDDEILHN